MEYDEYEGDDLIDFLDSRIGSGLPQKSEVVLKWLIGYTEQIVHFADHGGHGLLQVGK